MYEEAKKYFNEFGGLIDRFGQEKMEIETPLGKTTIQREILRDKSVYIQVFIENPGTALDQFTLKPDKIVSVSGSRDITPEMVWENLLHKGEESREARRAA